MKTTSLYSSIIYLKNYQKHFHFQKGTFKQELSESLSSPSSFYLQPQATAMEEINI